MAASPRGSLKLLDRNTMFKSDSEAVKEIACNFLKVTDFVIFRTCPAFCGLKQEIKNNAINKPPSYS